MKLSRLFLVLFLLIHATFTVLQGEDTVTHVDFHNFEKPVLIVDSKPFFYRGVQVRVDTMRMNLGWSDAAIGQTFQKLKADGFNVVSINLFWKDVEPEYNQFDWTLLDQYLSWCEDAGLGFEIAWFGSDSTAYSWGNGSNMDRVPDYVKYEYTKVTREDGSVLCTPTYRRYLLDKTDSLLLKREKYVLGKMFTHIAERNAKHGHKNALIGIQLLNEPFVSAVRDNAQERIYLPRSYSVYANRLWESGEYSDDKVFRNDVMLNYLTGLGEIVKNSDYSVWTRANFMGASDSTPVLENNQIRAIRGYSHLDFLGLDPYTLDLKWLFEYSQSVWGAGDNLCMVMENYAGGVDIDYTVLAAKAGGAIIKHYSAVESESLTDTTGYPGVYDRDLTRKIPVDSENTRKHRKVNQFLNKIAYSLATLEPNHRGGSKLFFFNPLAEKDYSGHHTVGKLGELEFSTKDRSVGIAVVQSPDSYLILAYAPATFSFTLDVDNVTASTGYLTIDNKWVSQTNKRVEKEGGQWTITLRAGEAVRLLLHEHEIL